MRLTGNIIKGTRIKKRTTINNSNLEKSFHDILEEAFIALCKELDIPVPIWMKKNTNELALFRRTFFNGEQFTEDVDFDRLELRLERSSDI